LEVAVRFLHVASQLLPIFRAAARLVASLVAGFAPALTRFVSRNVSFAYLFAQSLAILPAHAPFGGRHRAHPMGLSRPRLGERRAKREREHKGDERSHGLEDGM
jgi:hypothetical protein